MGLHPLDLASIVGLQGPSEAAALALALLVALALLALLELLALRAVMVVVVTTQGGSNR